MAREAMRDADSEPARGRLESWKEIATYLGRDVRTVQRWERRDGLPVHRLQHRTRASVFAYPTELEAWRVGRDRAPGWDASGLSRSTATRTALAFGALVAVALLVVGLELSGGGPRGPGSPNAARLLADSNDASAVSPDVFEKYLKGLFHLHGGRQDVEQSVAYFEQAAADAPAFAPAYLRAAMAYQKLGETGTGGRAVADVVPSVLAMSRKALTLDPGLSTAHAVLANAYQQSGNWDGAEVEYRIALDIDPQDAEAHGRFAALLSARGRLEEGIAHARRARELDPLSTGRTVHLGWLLYQGRRYGEAVREYETVLAAKADDESALWFLGFALMESSRLEEAIGALERLAVVWGRNPAALGALARAYGRAGRRAAALALVEELAQRERFGYYVPPAPFVHAYVGLGDRDRAFAALERASRERSNMLLFVNTHPVFDSLRDDPRFASIVRGVGLE